MKKPITITATLPAWLPYFHSIEAFVAALSKSDNRAADMLYFSANDLGKGDNPYTLVGDAVIAVTIQPRDEITGNRVKALQAQLEAVQQESQRKQAIIREQISNLLALTNDVEAVEVQP